MCHTRPHGCQQPGPGLFSPYPSSVSPTSAYEHLLVLPREFGSREREHRLGQGRKQDGGEEAPSPFIPPSPFVLFFFNSHFHVHRSISLALPPFEAPAFPSPPLCLQKLCWGERGAIGALFLYLFETTVSTAIEHLKKPFLRSCFPSVLDTSKL